MKKLFTKTSTTSIIAVMIIFSGFALKFALAFFPSHIDAALKTQIIQGNDNIMLAAALYYFGSSKKTGINQQADTITNSPVVGTDAPNTKP
jgi:hypothetical protein